MQPLGTAGVSDNLNGKSFNSLWDHGSFFKEDVVLPPFVILRTLLHPKDPKEKDLASSPAFLLSELHQVPPRKGWIL